MDVTVLLNLGLCSVRVLINRRKPASTSTTVHEKVSPAMQDAVRTAGFEKFNAMADELVAQGVRWIWQGQGFPDPSLFPEQTFSMDLEPEFITLSAVLLLISPMLWFLCIRVFNCFNTAAYSFLTQ